MGDKQFLSELLGLVREAEEQVRWRLQGSRPRTFAEQRYEELKPLMRRAAMKGRDRIYAEFHPNRLLMHAVAPLHALLGGDLESERVLKDRADLEEIGWLLRARSLQEIMKENGLFAGFTSCGEGCWLGDMHATDYQALKWGFIARHFPPSGGTYLEVHWR